MMMTEMLQLISGISNNILVLFVLMILLLSNEVVTFFSSACNNFNTTKMRHDFCHINNFSDSKVIYHRMKISKMEDVTGDEFYRSVHFGEPFVASAVTGEWKANYKWNSQYFESVFSNAELFSSTFATNASPVFDAGSHDDREIYYGIFLNDRVLSDLLSADYSFPSFVPEKLQIHGNEWIHWGYPPCGAKRHMDLMLTSRVSVQIVGSKHWRFYPVLEEDQLENISLSNWTLVLKPLEVILQPGDAVVWFPGWEHETRIIEGQSISLSLHFHTTLDSLYVRTFRDVLGDKVSQQFLT